MSEHESTFPPSTPPPPGGLAPPPPARRHRPELVEWIQADRRNHVVVICQADGALDQRDRLIGLALAADPEAFSIVVMAGPWLLGGFYLSPLGWRQLDPPEYHLAH